MKTTVVTASATIVSTSAAEGTTVMVKVCAALVFTFGGVLLPLSDNVTLNVAVPFESGAGV